MKVINISKKTVLSENITFANSCLKKVRGLIGTHVPHSLFFRTRFGVHTFGVRFPIDCVVCDNVFKIATIRENLVPNRIFFWNPRYKNIFEFPASIIKQTGTQAGDQLEIIN